jgi:hypothetical protein
MLAPFCQLVTHKFDSMEHDAYAIDHESLI